MLDDHTPFVQKGIPAIDLIDFDFPCWHQTCDDLTAVSKESLDLSGEAVLEYVLRSGSRKRERQRPAVGAGAQGFGRRDLLLEGERERVTGDGPV